VNHPWPEYKLTLTSNSPRSLICTFPVKWEWQRVSKLLGYNLQLSHPCYDSICWLTTSISHAHLLQFIHYHHQTNYGLF
jgi:hypothetical protein